MSTKAKVGCFFLVAQLLITYPMWYYLLYNVLKAVNATETMWLIYWVYVPSGFIIAILHGMAQSIFED